MGNSAQNYPSKRQPKVAVVCFDYPVKTGDGGTVICSTWTCGPSEAAAIVAFLARRRWLKPGDFTATLTAGRTIEAPDILPKPEPEPEPEKPAHLPVMVAVGQQWRSTEKRDMARIITITRIAGGYACYAGRLREQQTRLDRLTGRRGWELVSP